jgi:hypothetical protein
MPPTAAGAPLDDPERVGPVRSYIGVILVELLVLAGLYWLGRHFG